MFAYLQVRVHGINAFMNSDKNRSSVRGGAEREAKSVNCMLFWEVAFK